ncbi:MAG TPA: DUF1572 family protein [Bacteroidia bacterium]|jgi:hypothetical protein|nr:DUF1572 family protein [Bacteroidia bacterium]
MSSFLPSAKKQLSYYRSLGEKTFAQLSDADLFHRPNEESNSIAMIVKHLAGNMLSRFTDFLTSDGEKSWRNRDSEFADDIHDRETMMKKWNEGWNCVFTTLDSLTESDLEKIILIRGEGQTVTDALTRQVAHYAYHVGQIVYVGKLLKDTEWKTLSIAKGKSEEYNTEMLRKLKNGGK